MIATLTLTGRKQGYQSTDGNQQIIMILEGDTYNNREQIKAQQYSWIAEQKHWVRFFPATKQGIADAKSTLINLGVGRNQLSTDMTHDEAVQIMQQ